MNIVFTQFEHFPDLQQKMHLYTPPPGIQKIRTIRHTRAILLNFTHVSGNYNTEDKLSTLWSISPSKPHFSWWLPQVSCEQLYRTREIQQTGKKSCRISTFYSFFRIHMSHMKKPVPRNRIMLLGTCPHYACKQQEESNKTTTEHWTSTSQECHHGVSLLSRTLGLQ